MVTALQRFGPSCGTPTAAAGPLTEGRFRAGALFAGRFRIIALQGRGGMGQVYCAQDLELGQPVALKFLTAFRSDERARNRLRKEVRLARQISHPNVCRVYDIGEASGELYLSMEYVDGEDLAGLLKRIGRLPVGKGIDIARKLCAGLAAVLTPRFGGWQFSFGTSQSAPHMSGVAALVIGQYPHLTPNQVRARIRAGADDILGPGHDAYSGHGRINAAHALQ